MLKVAHVEGTLSEKDEIHRVSLVDVMLDHVPNVADKLKVLDSDERQPRADNGSLCDVHLRGLPTWVVVECFDEVSCQLADAVSRLVDELLVPATCPTTLNELGSNSCKQL